MVTWQPPTILVVANFTQASNTLNFFRKSFFLFFQIRLTVFTQLCLSNHWNPLSYMISEMATRWLIYLVLFFWTFLHWNVVKTCKSCLNLIVAPLWCGPNNISPQTIQMATIKKHCCRQETLSANTAAAATYSSPFEVTYPERLRGNQRRIFLQAKVRM